MPGFHEVRSQRVRLETLSRNMEQLYRLSTPCRSRCRSRSVARVLEPARQVVRIDRFTSGWSRRRRPRGGAGRGGLLGGGAGEFVGSRSPLPTRRHGRSLPHGVRWPSTRSTGAPELRLARPTRSAAGSGARRSSCAMIAAGESSGSSPRTTRSGREPVPAQDRGVAPDLRLPCRRRHQNARVPTRSRTRAPARGRQQAQVAVPGQHEHELRTRSTRPRYTELILDNIFGEVPPEIRDTLERHAEAYGSTSSA